MTFNIYERIIDVKTQPMREREKCVYLYVLETGRLKHNKANVIKNIELKNLLQYYFILSGILKSR